MPGAALAFAPARFPLRPTTRRSSACSATSRRTLLGGAAAAAAAAGTGTGGRMAAAAAGGAPPPEPAPMEEVKAEAGAPLPAVAGAVPRAELAPGLQISRIVKGCWQLSGGHGGERSSDRTSGQAAVDDFSAFVKAGITTFDTADICGWKPGGWGAGGDGGLMLALLGCR